MSGVAGTLRLVPRMCAGGGAGGVWREGHCVTICTNRAILCKTLCYHMYKPGAKLCQNPYVTNRSSQIISVCQSVSLHAPMLLFGSEVRALSAIQV